MRTVYLLFAAALAAVSLRAEEEIIGSRIVYDHDINAPARNFRLKDGGEVIAPRQYFATDGGNMTLAMEPGSAIRASGGGGKREMPCDDVPYAICLGYGAGYVIADLAGGEIECTNGLFCVAKEAYTTCMVTGTVIRCKGFRLQAGPSTGYATFILGPGGELDITGPWGIRSYHDPDLVHTNYFVGSKDFRYYFELRGGKIKFEDDYLSMGSWNQPLLDHAPCLIMAPDTVSEIEVAEGKEVLYAGQLQGEGTLRKTGKGNLVLASGFIHNEGTIILEEGSMEMFMAADKSLFWGDLIVKPGAKLFLKGENKVAVPDQIKVCRSGALTVEEGAEVWYHNKTTGTNTLIDMNLNTENGGYIENRSTYRIGVSMNLGTVTWNQFQDELDDPYVGAFPEHANRWGRQRAVNGVLGNRAVSDIMRIYARSDVSRFITLSFWARYCSRCDNGASQLTNGNARVTNFYLDDCYNHDDYRTVEPVAATNYLYQKEVVEMPAPDVARSWQVRLADIPYSEFTLYLIFSANNMNSSYHVNEFSPVRLRLTTPDGLHSSAWRGFTYANGATSIGDTNWGGSEGFVDRTNLVEGVNYLQIHFSGETARQLGLNGIEDLSGVTIDVAPGPVSTYYDTKNHNVRCCLAGVQIVPDGEPIPELNINEYTAFTADRNIYALKDGDDFHLDFTSTNETAAIGFVHSLSNDYSVAPRILVSGREYPQFPGETSRYSFDGVNSDKIELDVMYLPWRDNQTNNLTLAQFAWVTNRWGGDGELSVSNRTLNSAAAIAGADSDGDDFPFQFEYITDSDLTKNSNPQNLVIVGRAISNDCLWLDVEYTRTENGEALTNSEGQVVRGWLGVTNGVNNAECMQLGMRRGGRFRFADDPLRAYKDTDKEVAAGWRGTNPVFAHSITNTVKLPLTELTNRFFRAVIEAR